MSSLYGKTLALVASVLVLALVVTLFAFSALRSLEARHHAHQLQETLLTAESHVQHFLRTRDVDQARRARRTLSTADSLLDAVSASSDRADLRDAIDAYRSTFDELAYKMRERGLHPNSGAEGQFRSSARTVERLIRDSNVPTLRAAMLSARRHEMAFLLHRRTDDREAVYAAVDRTRAATRQSSLDASTRQRVLDEIARYTHSFSRLAVILNEIEQLRVDLDEAQRTAHADLTATVATTEQRAQRHRQWALAAYAMACLVGLVLAYVSGRDIVQPLGDLQRQAERIVAGRPGPDLALDRSDEIGQLAQALNQVSDHLRRRQDAERALRDSRAFVRTILAHVQEGVVVFNDDLRCVLLNDHLAALTGLDPDAVRNQPAADVFPHRVDEDLTSLLRRTLRGEVVRSSDVEFTHPDTSSSFWYVGTFAPMRDGTGSVIGVVGTIHDVTQRRATEQTLIQAKERAEEVARLKTSLLNNLSHEIRTPLTNVIGYTQLLRDEGEDAPPQSLGVIEENAHRLLHMLNSMLALAKLEAGTEPVDPQPVSLVESVRETVRSFRPQAEQKDITLSASFDAPSLYVAADPVHLDRILHNLVSNAIKFTDAGRVRLHAYASNGCGHVAVHDTGRGIDPEFRDRLFEEFEQESSGLDRSHEGSGLGLAITKRLVDAHDGSIHVDSTPGKGSTFTVSFPRSA